MAIMFQLDAGAWIDPEHVESVNMVVSSTKTYYEVIVTMFSGRTIACLFDEEEDAERERDKIAKSINCIRSGTKPIGSCMTS